MMNETLQKEKGMVEQVITNVKRVTFKSQSETDKMREENKILQAKIKHIKELLEMKNPLNANKGDDTSKNFDQSSMRSGGGLSISGSVINEVQKSVNIFGAIQTLSNTGGNELNTQISLARVSPHLQFIVL